jgi:hypothetical protein
VKAKRCFDPDFDQSLRGRSSPGRWIGVLLVIAAVFGLKLVAAAERAGREARVWPLERGFPHGAPLFQASNQAPPASVLPALPRDPFVKMAAATIDPQMVTPAPRDIDEAMVVHPRDGGSPRVLTAPQLAPVVPFPGLAPSRIPHRGSPPPQAPRTRTPSKPR